MDDARVAVQLAADLDNHGQAREAWQPGRATGGQSRHGRAAGGRRRLCAVLGPLPRRHLLDSVLAVMTSLPDELTVARNAAI